MHRLIIKGERGIVNPIPKIDIPKAKATTTIGNGLTGTFPKGTPPENLWLQKLFGGLNLEGFDLNKITGVVDGATSTLTSIIPHKGENDTNESGQQAIGKMMMSSGIPALQAAGVVWNTLSTVGSATGLNSNKLSENQANKVGIGDGAQFVNNVLSFVPMAGAFMGKTTDAERSVEVDKLRGAYSGTADDIDTAGSMGGKRYISTDSINDFINEQNRRNLLMTDISKVNTLRKLNNYAQDLNSQNFRRYSGMGYQSTAIGKQGMKLLSKEELSRIYASKNIHSVKEEQVSKFQNGGSILIPEGALHAHKHHMEEENPELAEELTPKGIPVVSTDANGEIQQVAEIEREEIILEKTLTQQIEELWKDGSEEAMIKAGKIVTETMFKNCDDNANLIERTE